MRGDAFRAFLMACSYTDGSVASRMLRCRAVERRLLIDLDQAEIDVRGVAALKKALVADGVTEPTLAAQLNAVRTYARFRIGEPARAMTTGSALSKASVLEGHPARSPFVVQATTAELMRLYGDVLEELRSRGVARTANGPVGDYAELLVSRAFGLTLAGNSTAGHDATATDGLRYQIKGRRVRSGLGDRQLGAIRQLPDHQFDLLAAVLFTSDMSVLRAALIPHAMVLDRATYTPHTNSWRFMLSDAVWALPAVIDATDALRSAAKSL